MFAGPGLPGFLLTWLLGLPRAWTPAGFAAVGCLFSWKLPVLVQHHRRAAAAARLTMAAPLLLLRRCWWSTRLMSPCSAASIFRRRRRSSPPRRGGRARRATTGRAWLSPPRYSAGAPSAEVGDVLSMVDYSAEMANYSTTAPTFIPGTLATNAALMRMSDRSIVLNPCISNLTS